MESMRVDPQSLMSETTGTLHTMVGRQEVGAVKRTFRFDWNYTGVELRLIGFGIVVPNKPGEDAPIGATEPAPQCWRCSCLWHSRSEERRVGKACVSTCRSRGSPYQ